MGLVRNPTLLLIEVITNLSNMTWGELRKILVRFPAEVQSPGQIGVTRPISFAH